MTFNNLYSLILENSASRSYSCLMLDLSFLLDEFVEIQDEICPCEVFDDKPGTGFEKEPHITVCYGLMTDKVIDVTDKIYLFPVKFQIGKLSLFENDNYDVLKFDIISSDLEDLNKEINTKFIVHNDYGKYKCHSTVAYIKKGYGKFYLKIKNKLTNRKFISNKFIFSNRNSEKVWITV